jgi:protein-S-isoprenylcysteine O-methyltransferase Ste14
MSDQAERGDPRRFPFPPAIPVVALVASFLIGLLLPLPLHRPHWAMWPGLVLLVAPVLFAFWATRVFRRHGTPVNPLGKVTGVVDDGPFAVTRNPMYLSLMVVYVGGALLFDLAWAWVLLVPVFLALHLGVILPEERYLAATFGEPYLRYRARVRRWI